MIRFGVSIIVFAFIALCACSRLTVVPLQTIAAPMASPTPNVVPVIISPASPVPVNWSDDSASPYGLCQGPYAWIAQDSKPSVYPARQALKTVETQYGELQVPGDWVSADSDSAFLHFTNGSGSIVLTIYTQSYYPEFRGYLLQPNHSDTISWQSLKGYPCKVIDMALECDEPAASGDNTITIRRAVCFLLDGIQTSENGDKWGVAVCLSFNKATVNGGNIRYILSNSDIYLIVKSFKPKE